MIKIICVVNDEVKRNSGLKKEHGLSLWLEIQEQVVLFDTGQSPQVLSHNLAVSGFSPQGIHALALSHAHYDHTGGLDVILSIGKNLPLYALTDLFRPRYALRKGEYEAVGCKHARAQLSRHLCLHLSDDPQEIVPHLWTSGIISERHERVGGSDYLLVKSESGWAPDPYRDDMSLVVKNGQELILICGCCHAGLLSTLDHVEKVFGGKVTTVVGGTHLLSADADYLTHVTQILRQRHPGCRYYLNHCTGKQALEKMKQDFGAAVQAFLGGDILDI